MVIVFIHYSYKKYNLYYHYHKLDVSSHQYCEQIEIKLALGILVIN